MYNDATITLVWILILAGLVTLGFAVAFLQQARTTATSVQLAMEKLTVTLDDVRDLVDSTASAVQRGEATLAHLEATAEKFDRVSGLTSEIAEGVLTEVNGWVGTVRAVRAGVSTGLLVLGSLWRRRRAAHTSHHDSE